MLQRWIAYLTFMHHPYCLFSWFQIRSSQIFIKMCIFSCSLYIGYHSNSSSEHLYTLKINIEPKSHPLQRKFIFGKSPFCGFHILVSRSIYIPKKPWQLFCRHPTAVGPAFGSGRLVSKHQRHIFATAKEHLDPPWRGWRFSFCRVS